MASGTSQETSAAEIFALLKDEVKRYTAMTRLVGLCNHLRTPDSRVMLTVCSQFNSLKAALLARLPPKGCTLPLRVILHLRNKACCFMSKAEAQRVYKLTDKDFGSLTRVVSPLLQRVSIM